MKFNKAIIKDHLQDIRLMDCRDLEFCTDICIIPQIFEWPETLDRRTVKQVSP